MAIAPAEIANGNGIRVPRVPWAGRLRRCVPVIAGSVALTALFMLGCWAFAGDAFRHRWPAVFVMKPNTAISSALLAAALFFATRPGKLSRGMACVLASAAFGLSAATLVEYLAGVDLRIDQFPFVDPAAVRFPGRTSPGSAGFFAALAVAVGLLALRRGVALAQGLATLAAGVPIVAISGYLYHTPGLTPTTSMPIVAPQTAICQLLLCIGVLFALPRRGLMRVVISRSQAGAVARVLLPLAVILPLACGFCVDAGARLNWYSMQFAAAMLVSACALLFAIAVWLTTSLLWATERTRAAEIARRSAAEEQLGDREARLRMAIAISNLGTWELDLASRTFVGSDECRANFGVAAGAPFEHAEVAGAIDDAERERVSTIVSRAIAAREDYRVECRITWPDASTHWILARGRALYAADGRPVRLVGVMLDITERKRIDAEREAVLERERAARVLAEQSGQMKDEFLTTLSHELRTPLNAIMGWAQVVQRKPNLSAEVAQAMDVIVRNARSQTQIIEDLLDMSRIISGKVRLDLRPLSPAAVVDSAIDSVCPTADAKGVTIEANVERLRDVKVSGDAERLQQVLWNLLTNAIKFTPRGGHVRVALAPVESHLEITVGDTGEGIEPAFLPFVFDRFRQADASTTRRHGGLGLGLSIVRQLVELHGGTVRVASPGRGRGTTFVIALPVTALAAAAASTPAPQASPGVADAPAGAATPAVRGVRVLVVDDEPDARGLVRQLLEEGDALVATASSAEEAMRLLSESVFDVLVSDIGMPGEDGHALIRRVRRTLAYGRGGDIPAIALTAYARPEDRQRAIDAGFQNYLSKPVEPDELLTMIASSAGGRPDPDARAIA